MLQPFHHKGMAMQHLPVFTITLIWTVGRGDGFHWWGGGNKNHGNVSDGSIYIGEEGGEEAGKNISQDPSLFTSTPRAFYQYSFKNHKVGA